MVGDPKLGKKIRELRLKMGLTQSELGGKEFTKSFISQIEKGLTRPSLKSLRIIAARLNQPLSVFLDEDLPPSYESELTLTIETANMYHAQGHFQEAVDHYNKALSYAIATDHRSKSTIYYQLANAHFRINQIDRAIDLYHLSIDEAKRARDHELSILALYRLAVANAHEGDYPDAQRALRHALSLLSKLPSIDDELKLSLLSGLAEVLCQDEQYDRALEILKEAIEIAQRNPGHFHFATLCRLMGHVYTRLDQTDVAKEYTDKAISVYTLTDNTSMLLLASIDRARQLRKAAQNEEAHRLLEQIYDQAQTLSDEKLASLAIGELADCLCELGDDATALTHIGQAIQLDPYSPSLFRWTELIQRCAARGLAPPTLIALIQSLISRWPKGARTRILAEYHATLGHLYTASGEAAKASRHFQESVALFRQR